MYYSIKAEINQGGALYIINSEGIAYHQNEVLYIIKPQGNARWRVMRYKVGLPTLMICTALRAAMICQACGLDKKRTKRLLRSFLGPTLKMEPVEKPDFRNN